MNIEFKNTPIEFRSSDKPMEIIAKINDYGLSKPMRDKKGNLFREQVSLDTWKKAIAKNPVKLFYNHKPYFNLGENLSLETRADGVYLHTTLKDNEAGLYQAIKDKKVCGCSFGFKVINEEIINQNGINIRNINDMELKEISLLDIEPAYHGTNIEVRNISLNIYNDVDIKRRRLRLLCDYNS
ncbi:HK97 family phage prohead protease [Clostridium botulinum]|uniref:HK97 family phage prohead protease n=1 Tax=Clostridium botulinum TaxID=1491 RepID=UPI00036F454A|nr:HK97 family phage prohead protease [Clostridium botulinum]